MSSAPIIFDYFDYAKYLRDYYDARDRWFSYRFIQEKTGIDPGFLYKVFQGKRHLPKTAVPAFAKLLSLTKKESDYFENLIQFAKAKNNREVKLYFEKLLGSSSSAGTKVEANAYEYYTNWYNAAIRQIIGAYRFTGDYAALAKMTIPPITPGQARKAIGLLESLRFITKNSDGAYRLTEEYLTTGEEWRSIAIRKFQKDTIDLAASALETIPGEQRDISTVTVAISSDNFLKAKEIIRNFRKEILQLAHGESNPKKVYHVNVQMIPIGNCKESASQ